VRKWANVFLVKYEGAISHLWFEPNSFKIFLSFLTVYYKLDLNLMFEGEKAEAQNLNLYEYINLPPKYHPPNHYFAGFCVPDSNFNKNNKIVHTHVYEPKHHFVIYV
jgi:hypothetical protein